MKKIAVTGAKGQIGRRLVSLGAISLNCNILDRSETKRELRRVNPDVVIHAAGISSIDKCEQDYELALAVNVWGFCNVCELAGDGKVVLLSSEQVFDGKVGNYTEEDEPNPINNYGHSKLGAEAVARLYDDKIIRLSRGFSNRIGSDIYNYIEELKKGREIYVPDYIIRSYCHLDLVSVSIFRYAELISKMPTILNIGGKERVSFYKLMSEIGKRIGSGSVLRKEYNPALESGFSPRPLNCGLDVSLAESLGVPVYLPGTSAEMFLKEQSHAN